MHIRQSSEPRNRRWTSLGLAVVLFLSLLLRLTGIEWDDLYHLHPDERYIVWVGTTIEFPRDWETAFDPALSTFNPFAWPPEASTSGIQVLQGEPRSFAYGHWPLYLGVAVTQVLATGENWAGSLPPALTLVKELFNAPGRIEYHHLLLVGRSLAALFDTLTVWLVFVIGKRLYGQGVGLAAAALTAFTVLHIQQAHFFVTDPFLTTAVVAALYWMIRLAASGPHRWREGLVAGALMGLAVGAKFSAVLLLLPLTLAVLWQRRVLPLEKGTALARRLMRCWRWVRRPLAEVAVALLAAAVVFAVTNPFALLDNSCETSIGGFQIPFSDRVVPPLAVNSCYLKNIGTQGAMVRGGSQIPFTFQYIGTPPYVYYLDQMARWGQGIPLAATGFAGLAWAVWRVSRARHRVDPGEAVLLAWVIPFFIVTGSFQVKFLRYLLPLTPFLSIYGAALLSRIAIFHTDGGGAGGTGTRIIRVAGTAVLIGTLLFTALWAATFVGLYGAGEHPWISASRWINGSAPAGSTIATEHWDYALPVKLRDIERVDRRTYKSETLEWYDVEDRLGYESRRIDLGDTCQKLAESDYLILASNRLYGVIPRLPERYPETSAYYRLLMAGDLGWELVHWSSRYPTLNSLVIVDDTFFWPQLAPPEPLDGWLPAQVTVNLGPADESFTVYDHPLVLIFENRRSLTAEEMESLIRSKAAAK